MNPMTSHGSHHTSKTRRSTFWLTLSAFDVDGVAPPLAASGLAVAVAGVTPVAVGGPVVADLAAITGCAELTAATGCAELTAATGCAELTAATGCAELTGLDVGVAGIDVGSRPNAAIEGSAAEPSPLRSLITCKREYHHHHHSGFHRRFIVKLNYTRQEKIT